MRRRGLILLITLAVAIVFCAPPVLQQAAPQYAGDSTVYADTTDSTGGDTNAWVRIAREGYGDVQIGNYRYYYKKNDETCLYSVYRENLNTGSKRRLLRITETQGTGAEFYTNGKKVIYVYDSLGTMIKCKDIATAKTHTVVNLRKYRTSRSTDTHLHIHIYGKYLYYSKYRGLDTTIWNLYKVNINTGKSYIIKKNLVITQPKDQAYMSGRYFLIVDKSENVKVFDTKDKSIRKLSGKYCKCVAPVNGYWYFVTSSKPAGKTRSYNVWRKKMSGAGTAKRIASFKKNYPPDEIMELTDEGLYFLRAAGEGYTMKYNFAKKKLIRLSSRNVWYYVSKNMKYM